MTRFAPANPHLPRLQPLVQETVTGGGQLHPQAGDQIAVEVALQATANMPETVTGELDAGSAQWYIAVPIRAFVLRQPEVVPEALTPTLRIVPGGEQQLTVRLHRTLGPSFTGPSGLPRTVTITAPTLPAGVTMDPISVSVPLDADAVDATLLFHASEFAALVRDAPASLLVDSGADRETLALDGNVYPREVTFPCDYQVGDELKVKGELLVRSDGSWRWLEDLESTKTIFGDWYATSFFLNLPYNDPAQNGRPTPVGLYVQGPIGGFIGRGDKKVHIVKSSDDFPHGPLNEWMRQSYFDIADTGCQFISTRRPDIDGIAGWFADKLGGEFFDLAKGAVGL
jgi:hypothetical protein